MRPSAGFRSLRSTQPGLSPVDAPLPAVAPGALDAGR